MCNRKFFFFRPKKLKGFTNDVFDPNEVLLFDYSNKSLKIVWEQSNHQLNIQCFLAAQKTYHNYLRHCKLVGFTESVKKTTKFLSLHGIRKAKDPNKNKKSVSANFFDGNLVNDCFAITDLLNHK
jgi:hypothetical protein